MRSRAAEVAHRARAPLGLTALELAWGWPYGAATPTPRAVPETNHPRTELERIVLRALQCSPCLVSFSGGRDSSAILALAVHIARREGVAEPIPVTYVYPGDPAAEEGAWQEIVVRHLAITDWQRVSITDEFDLLGPLAQRVLHTYGVVFPSGGYTMLPMYDLARGGALLTGEFGDGVFGPQRSTPLASLIARRGRARAPLWRATARELLPAVGRRAVVDQRQAEADFGWLRPDVARHRRRVAVEWAMTEPFDRRRALEWNMSSRALRDGRRTSEILAADHDVRRLDPFGDPRFIAAYGAFGGRLGLPSRTVAMRRLFGDLLPNEIVTRRGKAHFNSSRIRENTRAFINSWSGAGVDPDLVDPEILHRYWKADVVHVQTFFLLQHAWLSTRSTKD